MKKLFVAVAVAASMMLAACGQSNMGWSDDQCLQAQNPQECAQVRDAGGDVQQYLIGGLGGYMLARMMTPSGPRMYLTPNPSYHGSFHRISSFDRSYSFVRSPSYRPYSARYNRPISHMPTKRVTTTTTYTKKGLFGGSKTVTKSVTRSGYSSSYRPSMGSYSSRSSSSYKPYRSSWSSSSYGSGRSFSSSSYRSSSFRSSYRR